MVDPDFRRRLAGFGLTTANIFYHRPDYPGLLQSFLWQHHDLHPDYPELRKFLAFWRARTRRRCPFGGRRPFPAYSAGGVQGGERRISPSLSA